MAMPGEEDTHTLENGRPAPPSEKPTSYEELHRIERELHELEPLLQEKDLRMLYALRNLPDIEARLAALTGFRDGLLRHNDALECDAPIEGAPIEGGQAAAAWRARGAPK